MKVFKFLIAGVVAGTLLASCGGSNPPFESVTKAELDTVSYAVGVSLSGMITRAQLEGLNYSEVKRAMQQVADGEETYMDPYQANEYINNYLQKVQMMIGQQKEKEQAEFMAQNRTKEGVQETASGLQYRIDMPGSELKAAATDTVEVHYKGTLLDGKVFDSSYERGEPAKFPLNRVIPGWTEGMQLVGEGGKITLWVPFNLGYGAQPAGEDIPAYSTLVFEVELIKVCKTEEKKK